MVWPFSRKQEKKEEVPDYLNTPIVVDQHPPGTSGAYGESRPAGKAYNPYEGMVTNIDQRALNRIYYIPDEPDLLFGDTQVKRKTWGDNLAYYTGFGCLTGFALGAAKGGFEAIRYKGPVPQGASARLLVNRVLNMGGENGKKASVALACLGLIFSLAESGVGYLGDNYVSLDYPEVLNSMLGGAVTGALYRAPRGAKAAGITGLVGLMAGAAARPVLDRNTL